MVVWGNESGHICGLKRRFYSGCSLVSMFFFKFFKSVSMVYHGLPLKWFHLYHPLSECHPVYLNSCDEDHLEVCSSGLVWFHPETKEGRSLYKANENINLTIFMAVAQNPRYPSEHLMFKRLK